MLPFFLAVRECEHSKVDLSIDFEFRREAFGSVGVYIPETGAGAVGKSELMEAIRAGVTDLPVNGGMVAIKSPCKFVGGVPQGPCEQEWVLQNRDDLSDRLARRQALAVEFSNRPIFKNFLDAEAIIQRVEWLDVFQIALDRLGSCDSVAWKMTHFRGKNAAVVECRLIGGTLGMLLRPRSLGGGVWLMSSKMIFSPGGKVAISELEEAIPSGHEVPFLRLENGVGLYRQGRGVFQLISALHFFAAALHACSSELGNLDSVSPLPLL